MQDYTSHDLEGQYSSRGETFINFHLILLLC